jgi:predicted unusual protein kinase regulating ubiquinone biosynthesis (AarF/ABC1/UbiB family)
MSSTGGNAAATCGNTAKRAIRKVVVATCLSFVVVVVTNASVALSFQQPRAFLNAVRFTGRHSSKLEATPSSTKAQHQNKQMHSDKVPYGEANYDPYAADEFYEARPMKSIGRFLQIASKSSRFVFDTTFVDENASDRSDNENTTGMTSLERKRSKELVGLLTALGPTFIKVGQALSTRTDLLPTDKAYYAIGLSELQDAVEPSFDSKEAQGIIRDELGIQNIDEVFECISEEPVASASIGQVYKGKLRENGMEVAVKVQRPNVLENVALDLYVMRSILAPLWNKFINSRNKKNINGNTEDDDISINKSNTDSTALVDAWGEGFVNELDYRAEAKATKEFTKAMKECGLGSVVFAPEVIDELSSTHVLTTKWVDGERLSNSDEDDVPRLCGVALNAYLTMLLDTGTLHCDPHPGNLLRTPDGKLCILDWGMVLDVPNDLQLSLLEFIADLNAKNYEDVPEDLVKLKFVPEDKIDDLRKSGLTVGIAKMLNLAAEGGGPKGAMKRMVAENKEKYAEALKDFDDLDSEEATKVRQKLFREDWNRAMAEDAFSREDGGTGMTAATSTTVDLTTKIESMRQQNTDVFAIPDYFVYMSRAFATLEGIGLSSNENYSILQECYPYLAKRLLSDDSPRARKALRTLLYGRNGKELDLTKLQDLSDGLESYTTSTSSVESGRSVDNNEGRDAAIEQVASVVLSADSNYVQELLLRETAVALDATLRDAVNSPLKPIMQNIPSTNGVYSDAPSTAPPSIFRPFMLPFDLAKASFELQSIDAVDERRLENVRILTKLASGAQASSSYSENRGSTFGSPNGVNDTIVKVAKEVAKRRLALARIGVRFGGTMASVQAERLRDRASSVERQQNLNVAELSQILAQNGAERFDELSEALHSFDNELGKR